MNESGRPESSPGRRPPERDLRAEKLVRHGPREYAVVGTLGTGKPFSIPLGRFTNHYVRPSGRPPVSG